MPDNVKSVFKHDRHASCPACSSPRLLPKLAAGDRQVHADPLDELHAERPVQPHGRHLPDADRLHDRQGQPVRPARAADARRTFPTFGSNIIRLKPPTVPMLPFVMMPRPLQESNVVGKGGTAGFLGQAYDPYYLYPARRRHGHDQDGPHQGRRPEAAARGDRQPRLDRRARLRDLINDGMPELDKAVSQVRPRRVLRHGPEPGHVRPGPRRVRPRPRRPTQLRERYGRNTFGQCCLLARRLVEAGTRVVEVIWPKVANSDNHSWDVHVGPDRPDEEPVGPDARRRPVGPDRRPGRARACSTRRWWWPSASSAAARSAASAPRGNGNSDDGRDHWPYCYTAVVAGAGVKRGFVHGKSDTTGLGPARKPGPPDRAAGDDLPHRRHQPGHDRLQPPEPAARAGEGGAGDEAVCVGSSGRSTFLAGTKLGPGLFMRALQHPPRRPTSSSSSRGKGALRSA